MKNEPNGRDAKWSPEETVVMVIEVSFVAPEVSRFLGVPESTL
jgi:hypothetical protein